MVLILILVLISCFFLVIFVGAPYLPTLNSQINNAFKVGHIKKGQTIIELGCGDGKVLLAAARKGINVVGYEVNPVLFAVAYLRTIKYRSRVKVIWGNYWLKDWPEADVIFVFLVQRYMKKLDKKCMQYPHKPVKLLSFAFTIPDKNLAGKKGGIYYYRYD
jgi:hypothetical protein